MILKETKKQTLWQGKPDNQATAAVDYKTMKSRHERELNKCWRDSVE